jgi:sulfite exporter TauE/SafE
MSPELTILAGTAASIGFFHTLFGPDHYVPFVVLAKARKWGAGKTVVVTFLCGLGHVVSSVILGFAGIALGIAVFRLETVESLRGEIAAWLLIIFGFTYFVWGLRKAFSGRSHAHLHLHEDGGIHAHRHEHGAGQGTVTPPEPTTVTPWVLFTIFVFGPCEPLIPILMYPAAQGDLMDVVLVVSIFASTTIGTMLAAVMAISYGFSSLPLNRIDRYLHALAGLTIFLCGGAIKFLGL